MSVFILDCSVAFTSRLPDKATPDIEVLPGRQQTIARLFPFSAAWNPATSRHGRNAATALVSLEFRTLQTPGQRGSDS